MAEIRGRAARSARPAHVLNHGRGHVSGGMAGEPEPVAEIDILSIAEEVFIESTRFDDQLPPVERGSRTGREDFSCFEITRLQPPPVALPPGQPADVPAVADAVEHAG